MDNRDMQERSRRNGRRNSSDSAMLPENPYQKKIAAWLKKLRFRRVILGGVSEKQVWKSIGELNAMYQEMLEIERARYEAILFRHGISAETSEPYRDTGPGGDGR